MALKAGYVGIKSVSEDLVLDETGNLKLADSITDLKCSEETAGTYTLSATVDDEGAVTYAWTAVE